jgi:hypothetical protein
VAPLGVAVSWRVAVAVGELGCGGGAVAGGGLVRPVVGELGCGGGAVAGGGLVRPVVGELGCGGGAVAGGGLVRPVVGELGCGGGAVAGGGLVRPAVGELGHGADTAGRDERARAADRLPRGLADVPSLSERRGRGGGEAVPGATGVPVRRTDAGDVSLTVLRREPRTVGAGGDGDGDGRPVGAQPGGQDAGAAVIETRPGGRLRQVRGEEGAAGHGLRPARMGVPDEGATGGQPASQDLAQPRVGGGAAAIAGDEHSGGVLEEGRGLGRHRPEGPPGPPGVHAGDRAVPGPQPRLDPGPALVPQRDDAHARGLDPGPQLTAVGVLGEGGHERGRHADGSAHDGGQGRPTRSAHPLLHVEDRR